MKVFIVSTIFLAAAVIAAPSISNNKIESGEAFTRIAKMVGRCAESGDLTACLAVKGINMLNRASRSNNIEVIPGVIFTRNPSVVESAEKQISESEILSNLPTESGERSGKLYDMALESATEFLNTHNLQVKIPGEATQELARALDEGRGKMKKLMGPLLLAVGAKLFALLPILIGAVALLATKALIVAKIAFVLAGALGLGKLFSGGSSLLGKFSGGGSQIWGGAPNTGWLNGGSQGWSSGSASYPYARNLDAQNLAYNAQEPSAELEH